MTYLMNNPRTKELFSADAIFVKGGTAGNSYVSRALEHAKNNAGRYLAGAALFFTLLGAPSCGGGGDGDGNKNPSIGSFVANPNNGNAPLTTSLQWSDVKDPDGDMLTCQIDADGNGTIEYTINNCAPNSSQQHIYTVSGNYAPRLTVTDGKGGSATTTTPVGVNAPAILDIQGNLIDALTGGCSTATQNIPIKLTYKSNSNQVLQVNTDSVCKYKFTVTLLNPPNNDQFNISISKGVLYGYSEDFATTMNLTKDLYDFEVFVDPLNATSTDPRKDVLAFIKYMTATDGSVLQIPTGNPYTILRTWRKQDRPIDVFPENPPTSPDDYSAITGTAITELNTSLGNRLRRVATAPTVGMTIRYSPSFILEGRALEGQIAKDQNGNMLYPITYIIEIREDHPAFVPRKVIVTKHELLRSILANGQSSPFPNHIMYSGVTQDMSPFEQRAFNIILNLSDNKDMIRYN